MILESLVQVIEKNALISAFAFVGLLVWFSYFLSEKLTRGHVHGSAIAIALGLVLAYFGGDTRAETPVSPIFPCLRASVFWAVRCFATLRLSPPLSAPISTN